MGRGQVLRLAGWLQREMERIAALEDLHEQGAEAMAFVARALERIAALSLDDRQALSAELPKRRTLHRHVFEDDACEDCYEGLEGSVLGFLGR